MTDLQVDPARPRDGRRQGGKKPTPYRGGQNVIRDAGSRRIVYMPPEASDVPRLMKELVDWLRRSEREGVPCPIRAGIAHYQFATIHPYYDGNGRTARLLTTLILHRGGYDLKGLYSLEEYYARDLSAYYGRWRSGRRTITIRAVPRRTSRRGSNISARAWPTASRASAAAPRRPPTGA